MTEIRVRSWQGLDHPTAFATLATIALLATIAAQSASMQADSTPRAASAVRCSRCGWSAPAARAIVHVADIDALERALQRAKPGDTVLLADGHYRLRRMLDVFAPRVTLRGASGDAGKVILSGGGMVGDTIGVAISVSAPGVTVADMTVRDVGFHAIQVRGERGASDFTVHNARLQDSGQQLLKGSVSSNGLYADRGLVACSEFSYTSSAPTNYTNGVDLLAARGWVIRDNRLTRIRGPEAQRWGAGPAILAHHASEDTVVERNLIVDSFRGIALGLAPGPLAFSRDGGHDYDHLRGIVRGNVIVNLHAWADEAIEANAARDVRIEHNTVLVQGTVPWSIAARFPIAAALVRNNLTNRAIYRREGGQITMAGNVSDAMPGWFVNAPRADLHLAPAGARAIDAGTVIPDAPDDFDRTPRSQGRGPDAGAFESRPVSARERQ